MSALLLCKPIIVLPQNYASARECRIVTTRPTEKENILNVEILEAPPVIIQPDLSPTPQEDMYKNE